MLESFQIQNFRALKDLKVDKTAQINLVVGANNVGKTTFLEAIHCALANQTDANSLHTAFRNGILNGAQYGAATVTNKAPDSTIEVTVAGLKQKLFLNRAGGHGGAYQKENSLAISVYPDDVKKTTAYYGGVKNLKKKAMLLKSLSQFDSRIIDLDPTMISQGSWELRVNTDAEEEIALNFMGQGFNRVLSMYCRIIASDRKIILIDELELGLHYQSIPLVWESIKAISIEKNLQIFATTHSRECIHAAIETFKENPEMFQLIRLEKADDGVKAKCIPHDYVGSALEHDVEIR